MLYAKLTLGIEETVLPFDYCQFKTAFRAHARAAGIDPSRGRESDYQLANLRAEAHKRLMTQADDKNWWKDPDKFIDGDEQRLHTGYPTERQALRNLRHEARYWIPRIERPMTFAEIIQSQGVETLYEVLAEKRPPVEYHEHRRRLGRPLKQLHKETGQLEPTPVILATLGLNAYVPA